jgi:acetyltransferase-like isoleucine patch superfamily enzyme
MIAALRSLRVWLSTYFPVWVLRKAFLRSLRVYVGKGTRIELGTVIREETVIGNNCYIGNGCVFEGHTRVGNNVRIESQCHITSYSSIGDYVFIAPFFVATNDNRMAYRRRGHGADFRGVTIERNARLAVHITTLPGITIGEGAIVGSMSLVTRDVKPYTIVRGIPARECKDRHGLLEEEILFE